MGRFRDTWKPVWGRDKDNLMHPRWGRHCDRDSNEIVARIRGYTKVSSVVARFRGSSNLLLALARTVILGFGPHAHIFVRSKSTYVFWNGASSWTRGGTWLLLSTTADCWLFLLCARGTPKFSCPCVHSVSPKRRVIEEGGNSKNVRPGEKSPGKLLILLLRACDLSPSQLISPLLPRSEKHLRSWRQWDRDNNGSQQWDHDYNWL
jgi:hypothetical protein